MGCIAILVGMALGLGPGCLPEGEGRDDGTRRNPGAADI